MFRTSITELFGIEHPVIGGCMQYVSDPEFVARICNVGALGIMASAMYYTRQDFRDAVRSLKELTDRPFAVNLNLFPALRPIDNEIYAEVILEEGVPIVETSGHRPPGDLIRKLKSGGVKTMHKCVSVRHALTAQEEGVDAVTLFGSEGGGHIAELGLTTMILIPRAVEVLDVPVIAAGGIADGKGLLAALALGACAVIIGTRLMLTDECPIHEGLKRALIDATELDTVPILGSVHNTLRALKNEASLKASELEEQGAGLDDILPVVAGTITKGMYRDGDAQAGIIPCSQAVGVMHEIKPVSRVIEDMVSEAEDIRVRLGGNDVQGES